MNGVEEGESHRHKNKKSDIQVQINTWPMSNGE
jgi:hypothetical protein